MQCGKCVFLKQKTEQKAQQETLKETMRWFHRPWMRWFRWWSERLFLHREMIQFDYRFSTGLKPRPRKVWQKHSSWRLFVWTCPWWPRHKISAELGQFHEESSFYQALHNGTVRGTCMILDEKACGKENGPGILGWFLRWRWNRFFCLRHFYRKKQVNWITFDHGWDTSSSPDALVRSCVGTSSDGWSVD